MVGVIAKKVGSTLLFSDLGVAEHVTLLHVDGCMVVGHKTVARDGYNAVVVGAVPARKGALAKPQVMAFAKNGVEPRMVVKEFRVDSFNSGLEIGSALLPSSFEKGALVSVVGTSKGKGFAGVMKRHGFAGLEATHGVSVSHRSHGSTGQRTYPSKVFRGKKMAGRMGVDRVTVKNLKVVYTSDNVVGVKGAVPGANGSYVLVLMG